MSTKSRYRIALSHDWAGFAARWRDATAATRASPFQHADWLGPWYAAFGSLPGVRPLLVEATHAETGELAMLLPLVERRIGLLTFVEFADLDVTDCNAPALGPAAPIDAAAAEAFWNDLVAALGQADVIRFTKLPPSIAGQANPLALLPAAQPSTLRTWSAHARGGSFEDYLNSLGRPYRKELRRSLRLFEAAGAARLIVTSEAAEARRVLSVIEDLQRDRLDERQAKHIFDRPEHRRFYDDIAARAASGNSLVTALEIDGQIVAGLLALCDKPRVTLIRIANRGGELARIDLGRLLIERTLNELHGRGYTHFDFSIGDGPHKRRFAAEPEPIVEIHAHPSWRGRLYAGAMQGKELVRRLPGAEKLLRGRQRPAPEAA